MHIQWAYKIIINNSYVYASPIKDASLELNAESYGFTLICEEKNSIVPDNYCYLQA